MESLRFQRLANTDGLPEVAGRLLVLVEASEVDPTNISHSDGFNLQVLVLRYAD